MFMDDTTQPTTDEVLTGCRKILQANKHGDYTIPAEGLYPHQWLWDSCFIAIGLAEYDVDRAQNEIRSLLRGQWSNGMLPHMIFDNSDEHKRDRNIWQSWRNPHAPDKLATSGMTQPPMLAEAVVRIGNKMKKLDRRGWYQDMYPALIAHHQWLYNERDPHDEGLAMLIHPWESGLDNSPPWIDQLRLHSRPWWVSVIDRLKLDKIALLFRRDTKHVPPGQRLDAIDSILYFTIMQRLKRKDWDTDRILSRSHFSLQDLTFNCILIRANQHLRDIAKCIGRPVPDDLDERMNKSEDALEKLWDGFYKQYYSRAFISHKLVKEPSIATLMPLYAGSITKERAVELVKILKSPNQFGTKFPLPSVPVSSNWYKELGYWQGPMWVNTNWLIADGLDRYGFSEEARHIREQSIAAVSRHGPYEYFSARTGEPAGAKNFSWTAALIIHMIKQTKSKEL
jgi:hypothetical protein